MRPMRGWRGAAFLLAILAFALAGAGPAWWLPGGIPPEAGRTAFFWVGVVCFLAWVWGRTGT